VPVTGRMTTLSQVLREYDVAQVDLLKIDVEKSEAEVLAGVDPDDWPRIRQVVMEVHDIDSRVDRICELLESNGFEVNAERDTVTGMTGLYDVYARRPRDKRPGGGQLASRDQYAAAAAGLLDISALRSYACDRLPGYMVPSAFVIVDRLPLTVNGKVDRRLLPDPELSTGRSVTAPRTRREEILCTVMAGVLGVPRVGIEDDFFESGGNSVLGLRLISRIPQAWGVGIHDLYKSPTVAGLAAGVQ
jgi:hypothetical protein